VRADLERDILDRVAIATAADKAFAGSPSWHYAPTHRSHHCLEMVAPLLIEGVSISGLQARLNARSDLPEMDVHAQLELWCPEIERYLHFERMEWKPNRPHTNPFTAPAGLKGKRLTDRHHSFTLNRRLGIPGLLQTVPLIGIDLPAHLRTFSDFMSFVCETWRITGSDFPVPPWQARLL
jgi:hypothetical protein